MKKDKIKIQENKINTKDIANSDIKKIHNFFPNKKIGLNSPESEEYLKTFGLNKLPDEKSTIIKDIFMEIFSPFNFLLFFITIFDLVEYIISVASNNANSSYLISSIIVFIMIILSTTVSLVIEYKTNSINSQLQNLIKSNIHIIRNKKISNNISKEEYSKLIKNIENIESTKLAIGDLVHISTGDIIPANLRIIYEHHLLVNESSITGESENVHKRINLENRTTEEELSYQNICYPGSSVVSGFAIGVVYERINNSYLNELSNKNEEEKEKKNSFQITLKKVTKVILLMVFLSVLSVFFITSAKQLILGNNDAQIWLNSLVFSIAIAVGLIPESLPVIISANLSRGSKNMANKKMLVKGASTVQDIGLINILCTDKTGTLTNNEIILDKHFGFKKKNNEIICEDNKEIFKLAYSNSYFQTGLVNNSIDNAILLHKNLFDDINSYVKIDEIPFNFKRRILSVIIKHKNEKSLISKGAFEEILKISSKIKINDNVLDIDNTIKNELKNKVKKMNDNGLRVVAIGYKNIAKKEDDLYNDADEKELILSGFLTFLDTPKKGIEDAIKIIDEYDVNLKIISGDNKKVTKSICERIGLKVTNIITGSDLNKIPSDKLYNEVNNANVFVKISPHQKSKIIEILQKENKVGFLGDGINDSIALKQSDVAISVDNATEIAKESSDVILLQKDLRVIENGLIQGRSTFANIVKFIKITLVNKFALMLTFLVSSIWLKFELMTPFQILLLDLILDFVQMVFILDNVDLSSVKRINDYKLDNWYKFALVNAPIISIISIINFAVMQYIFGVNVADSTNIVNHCFYVSTFTQIGLTSILSIFILRTKNNFIISVGNIKSSIIFSILGLISIILLIPHIPTLNEWLQLDFNSNSTKINFGWWYLILVGYLVLYWILQEIIKVAYIKYFKLWV